VAIHYAVQGNPHPRLLAALHAAGCRFEAVSWSEVRAAMRAGADPSAVLFTQPVKPADDIARARRAGVWRFAADSDTEPGRAIAAPAGTTFATVTGTAWRGGTLRVSLDTGAFHGLIEALESGRQLAFPVTIPAAGNRPRVPCMLTGPSCDSQDTILDRVWLPTPRADD
jgi:ornithine decarboxylase